MAPLIFNLVALLLWTRAALAVDCSTNNTKPIALPLKDVEVDPRIPGSFMRGVPARLGSPPQSIVLLPWAELNNTWIYDGQAGCSPELNLSKTTCRVRRGSYFRSSDSKTFRKMADIVAAGGSASEIATLGTEEVSRLVSSSFGGTDVFSVGDGGVASVDSMPIGVPSFNWDHGYTTMHTLGLGSDSVYLRALVKAGKIPSRVWSFFWGRTAGPNQMDGSVVLGGYDRQKVRGSNYTQRLDYSEATGCWTGMKVTISGIEANFWNGTNSNIIDKDQPLSVCIVPHRQHLLELPGSVLFAFMDVTSMKYSTSSRGLQWTDLVLDDESPIFDGDVTITINSQLPIRIPNDQYIIPDTNFDSQGRRVVNNTAKVLAMSSTGLNPNTPTGNNPYTLGRWFFTSAVLMVDHDAGTFTLWQANPLPDSDLVAVSNGNAAQDNCTDTPNGAGGNTESQNSGGSNTGAIAGGVVGGFVGLGVIIAVAFLLVRRRAKKEQVETPAATPAAGTAVAQPYKYMSVSESAALHPELPGGEYTPSPLELSDGSSYRVLSPDGQRGSGYHVHEMPGSNVMNGRVVQ